MQLVILLTYFSFEGSELWNALKLMINTNINFINNDSHLAIGQWLNTFSSIVIRFTGGLAGVIILTSVFTIMAQVGSIIGNRSVNTII
ncbi:hypothetical protein AB6G58_05935 [Providencia huaxiensis]